MVFTVELSEREWSRICVALDVYNRVAKNPHNAEIKEKIYTVMGRVTRTRVKPDLDDRKGDGHEVTL